MCSCQIKTNGIKGFTLIELLVTIAIVGVMVSMAVPSFTQAISNSRLTTQANDLLTSLSYARSEAIKRGQPVTVRQTDGVKEKWESGWTVFTDLDGDGDKEDNGELDDDIVLRVHKALPTNFTLRSSNRWRVTYKPTGLSGNVTFVVCDNKDGNDKPEKNTSRVVIINTVGRVRMGPDNDKNGIPEKEDGSNIGSCV